MSDRGDSHMETLQEKRERDVKGEKKTQKDECETLHFSVRERESCVKGGVPRDEKARERERDKKEGERERESGGSVSRRAGNRGRADRRVGERASEPKGKEREGGGGAGLVSSRSQSEAGVALCRVNLTLATQ